MNDTIRKESPLRLSLPNRPLFATVLFCLAYGSVMALLIAPRSLLSTAAGDVDNLSATVSAPVIAGYTGAGSVPGFGPRGDEAQLLKAGFTARPAEARIYGVPD